MQLCTVLQGQTLCTVSRDCHAQSSVVPRMPSGNPTAWLIAKLYRDISHKRPESGVGASCSMINAAAAFAMAPSRFSTQSHRHSSRPGPFHNWPAPSFNPSALETLADVSFSVPSCGWACAEDVWKPPANKGKL